MATVITEAELLEAISRAMQRSSAVDAPTMDEIRAAFTIGEKRLYRVMRGLVRQGEAEVVPVIRHSVDGRPITVPGYRAVKRSRKR